MLLFFFSFNSVCVVLCFLLCVFVFFFFISVCLFVCLFICLSVCLFLVTVYFSFVSASVCSMFSCNLFIYSVISFISHSLLNYLSLSLSLALSLSLTLSLTHVWEFTSISVHSAHSSHPHRQSFCTY